MPMTSQSTRQIPGTSSIHHLEENMAVATIELDAEARELLRPSGQEDVEL
jgi:aryl-alcohol dehydrogenase-like predicted oxidoreductase